MQHFIVQEKIQLLPFLKQKLTGFKNNTIKQYLHHGSIYVNGVVIRKHDHWLQPQDEIKISNPRQTQAFSSFKIKILYEDSHLVVIDKPADLLSVPGHGNPEHNALVQTAEILKKRGSLRNDQLFPAHRLDLGTSGVLLFTKNKAILQDIWDHWTEVHKDYLAIVKGHPNPKEKTITLKLLEAENQKVYVSDSSEAYPAITRYKTIKTLPNDSLLEVNLITGYKHQIRVHLDYQGNPILGDRKYGNQAKRFSRLALHASKLSFSHPKTQKIITVESPMPQEFIDFLSSFELSL